ncbi:MAG: NAD(P)-binding domain-containing protein [Planctomycetes bacterium]|nr:NAD(P)-binding domain-containing protein [Planctomycetota bacterium]
MSTGTVVNSPAQTESLDRSRDDRFCVLGAGASGLAVAKNFHEYGIPFDCFEREDDIGGNWYYGKPHSSVYRSTRLISSKRGTEYTDFPMPADWPEHPPHELVWQYLRSYARHFDLYANIQFNTAVKWIEPAAESKEQRLRIAAPRGYPGLRIKEVPIRNPQSAIRNQLGWHVTLADGTRRRYRGVVIANGHNWDPRWPEYPGTFRGEVIHSSQYKTPEICRGKRVLVVGGGNSGFDIAVDVAPYAAITFHSLRRGYHLLPRYFRGAPVDERGEWALRWRVPLWLRRFRAAQVRSAAWGKEVAKALPRPDHRLFETHPVINSRWPYAVSQRAISVRPDVEHLEGDHVSFVDGSRERIDAIIYATGYKLSFPFMDCNQLNWRDDRPELYLNIFHPQRDDLFVAGLIQPDSGQFGLVDYQAQLIAAYVVGLNRRMAAAGRFQREKDLGHARVDGGIRYVRSPRHLVEVEHYSYRRTLQRKIAGLCGRRH